MKIRVTWIGRGHIASTAPPEELSIAPGTTVSSLLRDLTNTLQPPRRLSVADLVVVGGEHVGSVGSHDDRELRDGDELTIISPVAGG